jgi:hypothetical protein
MSYWTNVRRQRDGEDYGLEGLLQTAAFLYIT